jgi:hypothetical protein
VVKERVELYLCSRCGPSWPVIGGILALIYKFYIGGMIRVEVLKKEGKKDSRNRGVNRNIS